MNWKRILLFIGLSIVATFIAGFIPGSIRGVYSVSGSAPQNWTVLLQAMLVPLALFLVFLRLGRVQRERPWEYAALVWGGAVAFSFLNLLAGQPLGQSLIGIAVSAVAAAVGIGVGIRMQPKTEMTASEPPA